MAEERTARPVSGEIMTGAADQPQPARPARHADANIVEAEYEVLSGSARTADRKPVRAAPIHVASPPPLGGMDMLRMAGEVSEHKGRVRGDPAFWIAGIAVAAAAFWISGGHALVRQIPLPAMLAEAPALSITQVTSRVDASGPKPVLFVDGEAVNDGSAAAPLPALEIHVTGNDGLVTHYKLGTGGRSMASGEKFAFSSRLDMPKNGVKSVSVTFGEQ
jgi:hypothetical protein